MTLPRFSKLLTLGKPLLCLLSISPCRGTLNLPDGTLDPALRYLSSMSDFFQPLLDRAFHRIPSREANAGIQTMRDSGPAPLRSYEATLEPGSGAAWLSETLLPRLVYHLESLTIRPPDYPGIFLSLFVGEELLFLHMVDVMRFASQTLGLSDDQIYARWGTQELRTAVRAPDQRQAPLLLPGPSER
jgi:hypothetical protein